MHNFTTSSKEMKLKNLEESYVTVY